MTVDDFHEHLFDFSGKDIALKPFIFLGKNMAPIYIKRMPESITTVHDIKAPKALNKNAQPRFETVMKVLGAMNIKMNFAPVKNRTRKTAIKKIKTVA